MKKVIIFFILIVVIISGFWIYYLNYKADYNKTQYDNLDFNYYYQKDVYGSIIASVINKAIDNNLSYGVSRDEQNKYIENSESSIKIDIKFTDIDKIYDMETIYASGIDNFVKNYGGIKFNCTKIEYHKSTKKIKYMLFEQVTE